MSGFDPLSIMLRLIEEADTKRLRITHFAVNEGALMEIARIDGYNAQYSDASTRSKPVHKREFMGIPLKFMPEWYPHDDPRLEAVHEHHGRNLLIHDYTGDILHGNALSRFRQAVRDTLESVSIAEIGDDESYTAEDPEHWSHQGSNYDGMDCKNCGRLRVLLYGNGRRICEKCNWDQESNDYAIDHNRIG